MIKAIVEVSSRILVGLFVMSVAFVAIAIGMFIGELVSVPFELLLIFGAVAYLIGSYLRL